MLQSMFKVIRKEIHTLSAAIDPHWNWRTLRPVENPIHEADNIMPDVARAFMRNLDAIGDGTTIVYGGALNDLANGRTPKDFDSQFLTRQHPLLAMRKVERWANANGYEVKHYRRRVRLLWKRLIIKTEHGDYDLGFLQGRMPPQALARQFADEADVSPCARSATAEQAFISQRCLDGEANDQLIFRRLGRDRDRFRHLDRFHKYAIVKYPGRAVVYQSPFDAAVFSELNERRRAIAIVQEAFVAIGCKPVNFEPFRPIVPVLYDRLQAKAKAQLT